MVAVFRTRLRLAIAINIHESPERATPRERNKMAPLNQMPQAWPLVAILELSLESTYTSV